MKVICILHTLLFITFVAEIQVRGYLMTTFPLNTSSPGHVPFDIEKYPLAPVGLILEQVYMFVRHGERTPVSIRMSKPPASIPSHWMFCYQGREFKAAVVDLVSSNVLKVNRVVDREDGSVHEGECLLGELTDVGRQSTYNLGVALRRLYVEKLGFLPDTVHNNSEVYFRSTNLPRTIESLQQIVHGLYPTNKRSGNFVSNIRIRNPTDENLFGNVAACERLKILMVGFAKAAAIVYNPMLEPLDAKLSKYIGGNPVRLDGKPRASGILDTIRAAVAHGIKVPSEFEDQNNMMIIETAVVAEWFSGKWLSNEYAYLVGIDKNEEVRRLGFGRLLNEISHKMNKKATEQDEDLLKILVHSTHDTAIAGLSETLGVFDNKWPPFTAAITFELFKGPSEERTYLQNFLSPFTSSLHQRHYVRMRYQNRNMILPSCQDPGKHLEGHREFCTLSAFNQRVKELTPVNWDKECA